MMRRVAFLAAVLAGASVASAQMPPSISKPIDAARKSVAATNAQSAATSQQPAKPAVAAKPVPAKSVAPAAAAPAAAAPARPAAQDSNRVTFQREVFTYVPRDVDPFASPIETGAIRPLVADLKLVGIIFDANGRNSVAVFRDISTQQQYRAKAGQMLGRARVAQIRPQEVILSIEEYGFSRQETLTLNTQQTQQTKGKP